MLIAIKLAEVFKVSSVKDRPIFYNSAWYEQKAVSVLLALLSLGVKNIHLGPTLPAFLSTNVAKVLDPVVAVSLQADGMTRFRCAPVMGLFPGDQAWVEGIPWRVARIAVSVNDKTQSMEVLAHG